MQTVYILLSNTREYLAQTRYTSEPVATATSGSGFIQKRGGGGGGLKFPSPEFQIYDVIMALKQDIMAGCLNTNLGKLPKPTKFNLRGSCFVKILWGGGGHAPPGHPKKTFAIQKSPPSPPKQKKIP